MLNHPHIRRVICGHSWSSVTEWATALDSLAEASDEELEILAKGGEVKDARSARHDH